MAFGCYTANLSDNEVTLLARLMVGSAPLKWPVSFLKARAHRACGFKANPTLHLLKNVLYFPSKAS